MIVSRTPAATTPAASQVATPSRPKPADPALARDSVEQTSRRAGAIPATAAATPKGESVIPIPHRYQGEDASCGPSSLWMVMSHHLGAGSVDFKQLDRSLRPTGKLTNTVGTMPTGLAEAARRYGLSATVRNEATTADLRRLLDQGLPVIVLGTWTDGVESDLHFEVVNGYHGNDDRTATWDITDPYVPGDGHATYTTQELQRFWSDPKLAGIRIPYQRAIVAVAPTDKTTALPADNRSTTAKILDRAMIVGSNVLRLFDNR